MKVIYISVLSILFSINTYAQTPGILNFSYTTLAKESTFSPKHVIATWVETESGLFVKTLNLNADKRKEHLYTWNVQSSGNTIDATTGATLSSHTSHNLSWDMTGTDGVLVDDGNYKLITEFTSEHAQGPLLEVSFSKTENEVSLQPDNQTYFETISLSFIPESTTSIDNFTKTAGLSVFPNPITEDFSLHFNLDKTSDIKISVYDSKMSLIKNLYSGHKEKGEIQLQFNLKDHNLSQGIYYILVKTDRFQSAKKIIVSK